jgi:hypothetical protein
MHQDIYFPIQFTNNNTGGWARILNYLMNIREGDQRAHISNLVSGRDSRISLLLEKSTPDETKPWFINGGRTPQIVISSDT